MEQHDIIENLEALKQTMKHKFPHGNWVETKSDIQLGRFEVQFAGQRNPEVFTVFTTGAVLFQGSKTNGATLRKFFETLTVANLLTVREELFEPGSRLQELEVERQYCYQQKLPNATALLMKAILEDLWKDAFDNTGFDAQRMEAAIVCSNVLTKRDVGQFQKIRGYGNGVGHSKAWVADMSDIISVQAIYEQLVSKLMECKKL